MLGAAIADPANHVSFRLSAGDTLFVNGYRVLHARTAYQPDGPRHLQDVYFEMDDVFGHLARMSGEATNAMVTPLTSVSRPQGRERVFRATSCGTGPSFAAERDGNTRTG